MFGEIKEKSIFRECLRILDVLRKSLLISQAQYLSSRLDLEGGILRPFFAGYVPLASQSPYPIIVYSVVSYRLLRSHFRANM